MSGQVNAAHAFMLVGSVVVKVGLASKSVHARMLVGKCCTAWGFLGRHDSCSHTTPLRFANKPSRLVLTMLSMRKRAEGSLR